MRSYDRAHRQNDAKGSTTICTLTVAPTSHRFSDVGDDDLAANGAIVVRGGPGVSAASAIPTLRHALLAVLALLLVAAAWLSTRRPNG